MRLVFSVGVSPAVGGEAMVNFGLHAGYSKISLIKKPQHEIRRLNLDPLSKPTVAFMLRFFEKSNL